MTPPERTRRRKKMDASSWILLLLTVLALAVAALRDPQLPWQGLLSTRRLLGSVWLELCLGFILAGLFDVLIPSATLIRWLGDERPWRGILIGWGAGLVIPGGPYLLFPMVANLFAKGAGAGPLIALVTAKTLMSPIRMLTYEAPLVGWPFTLARFIPGVFLPPVMAVIGQWLFRWLSAWGARP
jgi:uncharacterized membrane protein YraQ (UPF0718 family)